MRDPFPLQWPDGWKRTSADERRVSRFRHGSRISFARARTDLFDELRRLGAANVVLTSDLPLRRDGLPYATGRCDDPAIAVWFVLSGHERVFACDRWQTPAENIRSITLSVAAMRALGRYGMRDIVSRAFSGFKALPSGDGISGVAVTPHARPWREVFEIGSTISESTTNDEILDLVRVRHRRMMKTAHPDAGGSTIRAAELNVALAEAQMELGEEDSP